MANITINNKNAIFKDNASVIRENNEGIKPEPHNDAATIQDLREIQNKLTEISDLCGKLQKAIDEKDKPKISEFIGELTKGVAGSVIEILAGETFKKFLGGFS